MDRTAMTFIGGVLLVAFIFFAAANALLFSAPAVPVAGNPAPGGAGAPGGNGSLPSQGTAAQIVHLSVQGSSYVVNPGTVRKNQAVQFVADMQNMPGCSKALVIPQLGVRKVFQQGDNVLEFTPTQSGTLSFSCSMGMFRGTLNVV